MARKRDDNSDVERAERARFLETCLKTQISFVRNLADTPFPAQLADGPARALAERLQETLTRLVPHVRDCTNEAYLCEAGEVHYGLSPRTERGPHYRLLLLSPHEGFEVWCELMSANHLTFSICGNFQDFESFTEALRRFVDGLAEPMGFAYDAQLGYLTAQTSLIGTGLRIRSWLHLGGLAHFGYLRELCNACEVKGSFVELEHPDSSPPGDVIILFNRFSLGMRAREIAALHTAMVMRVSEQESLARLRLVRDEPFVLLDALYRAKATLKNAILMSESEALDILSDLRVALLTGALKTRDRELDSSELFETVRGEIFFIQNERMLSRYDSLLPPDVKSFVPWRNDALRAIWMKQRFATFTISKELIERAAEQ